MGAVHLVAFLPRELQYRQTIRHGHMKSSRADMCSTWWLTWEPITKGTACSHASVPVPSAVMIADLVLSLVLCAAAEFVFPRRSCPLRLDKPRA